MRSDEAETLDQILDQALARYSAAQPAPGFEQRILRGIVAKRRARGIVFMQWALPLAAVGCAVFFLGTQRPSAPPHPEALVTKAPPPQVVEASAPIKKNARGQRTALPKQPQFPMRVPITLEERAFVAFVNDAPEQALRAFNEEAVAPIAPIEIDRLEIAPLQEDKQ